jgi:hypothetical protein
MAEQVIAGPREEAAVMTTQIQPSDQTVRTFTVHMF